MNTAAILISLALLLINKNVYGDADPCPPSECTIDKNCRCSSKVGPLLLSQTPQLIVLAFVDAAKADLYNDRWSPLIESRTNPDGAYAGATFYVPHEYSDYQIVHDLAAVGFEIGVHSVTNDADQQYWRGASQQLLEKEFGAQREIISKFAKIPKELITGTLTPQLQLAGDNSINAFVAQQFSYDSSWPSSTNLYPYTLDYESSQACDTGANCPKQAHAGFWITPINDLTNDEGSLCATLAGCFGSRNNQTAKEISDWLVGEVTKVKTSNRAPITLIIEENLFLSVNESWTGLTDALDRLQADKEIFLVSQARVVEWIKNPVPIEEFETGSNEVTTTCNKETCKLTKYDGSVRYLVTCVPCPKNYPWLDNPDGN